MFAEIHRHLVLCKRSINGNTMVYRQIILIERVQFELRMFDCATLDLKPSVHGDLGLGELQLYDTLELGILEAEKQYKLSVTRGWRALDSTAPVFVALNARRAVA